MSLAALRQLAVLNLYFVTLAGCCPRDICDLVAALPRLRVFNARTELLVRVC